MTLQNELMTLSNIPTQLTQLQINYQQNLKELTAESNNLKNSFKSMERQIEFWKKFSIIGIPVTFTITAGALVYLLLIK